MKTPAPRFSIRSLRGRKPERKPSNTEVFWRNAPSKLRRTHATNVFSTCTHEHFHLSRNSASLSRSSSPGRCGQDIQDELRLVSRGGWQRFFRLRQGPECQRFEVARGAGKIRCGARRSHHQRSRENARVRAETLRGCDQIASRVHPGIAEKEVRNLANLGFGRGKPLGR